MIGLPDVWTGNQGRIGRLKPDIQIPGYKEYADRKFDHTNPRGPADEKIMVLDLCLTRYLDSNPFSTLSTHPTTSEVFNSSRIETPCERSTAFSPLMRCTDLNHSVSMPNESAMSFFFRGGKAHG